jgi:hypothetical protein
MGFPLFECGNNIIARSEVSIPATGLCRAGMSLNGTFRPFSNVRHSVVVGGKPDVATEPKWSE